MSLCFPVCLHCCVYSFALCGDESACLHLTSVCVFLWLYLICLLGSMAQIKWKETSISPSPLLPLLLSPWIISPLFFLSSFSPPLLGILLFVEVWLRSSSEHQWSEGSVCVCMCVFGDWLVIWAAWRWVLCGGAIHGRRLQMNASIHNYSLSICCSPRRLVVVFCFFFSAKKAIKAGQKQARAKAVYLGKKHGKVRRSVGVAAIRQSGLTISQFYVWEKLLDLFEHSCMNAISTKRLKQGLRYIFEIFLLFCYVHVLVPPLKDQTSYLGVKESPLWGHVGAAEPEGTPSEPQHPSVRWENSCMSRLSFCWKSN